MSSNFIAYLRNFKSLWIAFTCLFRFWSLFCSINTRPISLILWDRGSKISTILLLSLELWSSLLWFMLVDCVMHILRCRTLLIYLHHSLYFILLERPQVCFMQALFGQWYMITLIQIVVWLLIIWHRKSVRPETKPNKWWSIDQTSHNLKNSQKNKKFKIWSISTDQERL